MNELEGLVCELSPLAQQLNISKQEIYRTMGYGDTLPEESIIQLCDDLLNEARKITRPRFYFYVQACYLDDDRVRIGNVEFAIGRTISVLLRNSIYGLVFVASAGEEFQSWMEEQARSGDMLESFIIDAIGSTIAEATGDYMERELKAILAKYPMAIKHTNRFSPGYCGWNIEEQQLLFASMPDKVCGVELNSNSLMHPTKSISGVIGIGENVVTKKYGCDLCRRSNCYMRSVK